MSLTRASGVLLLLLVTACPREERRPAAVQAESPASPASPAPASPAPASPAPAGPRANAPWLARFDAAALAPRFAELRDARSIRCLLEDRAGSVMDEVQVDGPALVVRIAAFATVERARRDGGSPTLEALGTAIHTLAAVGDEAGLRAAFEMADQIRPGHSFHDRAVHRVRAGLPVAPGEAAGHRLALARELALAGDVSAAAQIYDHELDFYDRQSYNARNRVAVLVALERFDAARAEIAAAAPENRLELAGTWLDIALRRRRGIDEAVALASSEWQRHDWTKGSGWYPPHTLRAARRAGLAAEVAPLRRVLIAHWVAAGWNQWAGGLLAAHEEALALGEAGERASVEPSIPEDARRFALALYEGTLDQALAAATSTAARARVWVRHIAEGASPAFEARLAAAVCPAGAPPVVSGPPVPPAPGLRLTVTETNQVNEQECSRADLSIKLVASDGKTVDEETLAGECHGACTPAAKRAGVRQVRKIERAIARGEASDSELDYNFTGCLFSGPRPGRIDRAGGRDVALLVDHHIGAHGVDQDRYRLAIEVCGALFVSEPLAETYSTDWTLDELSLVLSPDGRELRVEGAREQWSGVLYRLTFPSQCPGAPLAEVVHSGE
jgi:hypothetical protein